LYRYAKMDASKAENEGLTSRMGVKGFPTVKLFRDGKAYHMTARGATSLQSFIHLFAP
jgi:protein-disulfide isomerase-like protein with CxxC motif